MVQPSKNSPEGKKDLASRAAERFGALLARADAAEMVVGVYPGGVAVGKCDLNRVIPYLRCSFGARLGLEHGQRGRRGHSRRRLEGRFFVALVIARRAGAFVAQIGEVVMAGVAVGPRYVHTGAARNVNLDAAWFFAWVEGSGHGESLQSSRGLVNQRK